MTGFFQVISRKNDGNGNPYRLMCVYNCEGEMTSLVQQRSSSPNKVRDLARQGYVEIPSVHVSPGEYCSFIIGYKRIFKEE